MVHSTKVKCHDSHHEQIPSIQNRFAANVGDVVDVFNDMGNSCTETTSDLFAIDTKIITGPEEAQGLQKFWTLHHLAFKFLNLTCHVMCSLHELLCILLIMSCNVLLVCHELCKPHIILIFILIYWSLIYTRNTQIL